MEPENKEGSFSESAKDYLTDMSECDGCYSRSCKCHMSVVPEEGKRNSGSLVASHVDKNTADMSWVCDLSHSEAVMP